MSENALKTLKTEAKVLSKVGRYEDFPAGTKWSQSLHFSDDAAENFNKTMADKKGRPLAANVGCDQNGFGYGVYIYGGFRAGQRAQVVLQDKDGNLSLAKETVGSVEEAERLVAEKYEAEGKQMAEPSMLKNTAFIEDMFNKSAHILVFSSKNPESLGIDVFEKGRYCVTPKVETEQKAGSTRASMEEMRRRENASSAMVIVIRKGRESDLPAIMGLMKELAAFERIPNAVKTSVEQLKENKARFDSFVAEQDGEIVGYTLYFPAYYTWVGKNIYMDDLYVKPEFRGQGIGGMLFTELVELAKEEKYSRIRWQVIDWNKEAIDFYRHWGAKVDKEMLTCDLDEEGINQFLARTVRQRNS